MKRKVSLLAIVLGALALALAGFLQDVSTSKALIPLPVQPMRPGTPKVTLYSTTALGQPLDSMSESGGGHGMRSSLFYANWTRGGVGFADIMVNDNQALGDYETNSDILCVATDDTTGGVVADSDGGTPEKPIPVPFKEVTTDVVAAGQPYLLANAGIYGMTARFGSAITTIWLFGTVKTSIPSIPVNILTLRVPWSMQTGVSEIWISGAAAKPSNPPSCSDSSENINVLPNGNVSRTMGSWTAPVAMTNTPPIRGDSSGPCTGPNCVDKRILGWWSSPVVVDASGGPQTIAVTQRALNGGPFTGNFKDVWHVEAPADVSATWGTSITEKSSSGAGWGAEPAPPVSGQCTNALDDDLDLTVNDGCPRVGPAEAGASCGNALDDDSDGWVNDGCPAVGPAEIGAEISFVEDVPVSGNSYEDAGSLTVTCVGTSDYIVSIKAAAYPIAPAADNDLSSNVALATIRVKCGSASEVDKQALSLAGAIVALSPGSVPLNPPIAPNKPPSDHVQLLVGDKATIDIQALSRAQAAGNVPTTELLVAEGPDMNGDGTYDIGLNWLPGTVTGVSGSEPANQVALPSGPTAVCIPWGPTPCSGLNVSMTEPGGPMVMVNATLEITCTAPGTYLVPLKLVEMPTTFGDSVPANNSSWQATTVYCWNSAGDVEDDGIDDSSGLYAAATSYIGNADVRRSVSPTSRPATGLASDSGYIERWVEWDCVYNDLNGAPDLNADGWISPAESMADPNIPAGIDDDGDCMADVAAAQPGHWADFNDVAGTAMCPAIVYNEGNAPYAGVTYLQSADEDCDGLVDGVEVVLGTNPRLADSDGDAASDFAEVGQMSNPLNPDTDGDGLLDKPEDDYIAAAAGAAESGEAVNADDNCPVTYNPTQANNDGKRRDNGSVVPGSWASNPNQDKAGDACDSDDDNDAALDTAEALAPVTDPLNPDGDGDGCVDGWESMRGTDPNSAASKCPASLNANLQKYVKGCHINLPGPDGGSFINGYSGSLWLEMDADGDGLVCQTGSTITDTDSDDGTGSLTTPPVEIVDAVEAMGYNTAVSRKDTDGDGCEDWIEIVDVNGNRSAELLDVLFVAKRALGVDPAPGSDKVLDIDKNGAVTILDALVAAKNSSLVKSHSPCASEG